MKGSEWKSARLLAALLDRPVYHPRRDIPAWQEVILGDLEADMRGTSIPAEGGANIPVSVGKSREQE